MPQMDECVNCGYSYCISCGDAICPRCGCDPDLLDTVTFEAAPELDAAINAGGEQDGLYSIDDLLGQPPPP